MAFPSRLPLRQGLRSTDSATRHPVLCSPTSSLLCLGPTPLRRASFARLNALALASTTWKRRGLPGPDLDRTCVRGFLDAAEPSRTSPKRSEQCCLRLRRRPRHSEQCRFRRSIALPTCAPADASPVPSRERPHGSGRGMVWLFPLPQRTSTSCSWPVSLAHHHRHFLLGPAAQEPRCQASRDSGRSKGGHSPAPTRLRRRNDPQGRPERIGAPGRRKPRLSDHSLRLPQDYRGTAAQARFPCQPPADRAA